ncbi:MAG: alpha-methylacyl-CoA racemase [Solirubrobacteraceae bacterium]
MTPSSGPFSAIKVVELGGIGPGPFAAMMLADHGADVLRIERPDSAALLPGLERERDVLLRGRPSIELDLKSDHGRAIALQLLERADVLIDPFRPGVTERLGLGPAEAHALNPRLVYGRMTGWGQTGPWAGAAGHDINYLALAGPLAAMGRTGSPPPPPLNLIADFGGGGMLLAFGIAAALHARSQTGEGQVIDAAMVDGVALLFASILGFREMGIWKDERESNALDGGAPFYDTYETADGRFVAVGALEPRFYAELLGRLGLDVDEWPQGDRDRWPALRVRLREIFLSRTRDEWVDVLGGSDACFAPVLEAEEAASHAQLSARDVYARIDGVLQPSPAPRFGGVRTPSRRAEGGGTTLSAERLEAWGLRPEDILRPSARY